jgi:copper homeostasis protein
VSRILTSGQRARAWEGRELIAELVRRADGRIVIMAGGGISEGDVAGLVQVTGVREVHVRATMIVREPPGWDSWSVVPFRKALPGDEYARLVTDPQRIAAIKVNAESATTW